MPRAIDSTSTKILKWFLTAPMAAAESMLDMAADALRTRRVVGAGRVARVVARPKAKRRVARPAPAPTSQRRFVKHAAKAAPKKSHKRKPASASDGLTIET